MAAQKDVHNPEPREIMTIYQDTITKKPTGVDAKVVEVR
jgi:hypothetical protein